MERSIFGRPIRSDNFWHRLGLLWHRLGLRAPTRGRSEREHREEGGAIPVASTANYALWFRHAGLHRRTAPGPDSILESTEGPVIWIAGPAACGSAGASVGPPARPWPGQFTRASGSASHQTIRNPTPPQGRERARWLATTHRSFPGPFATVFADGPGYCAAHKIGDSPPETAQSAGEAEGRRPAPPRTGTRAGGVGARGGPRTCRMPCARARAFPANEAARAKVKPTFRAAE
jgi:hypothetical protein